MTLFRSSWWPGLKPSIDKNRIMCSDCKWYHSSGSGWQYDVCEHSDADEGSFVSRDVTPRCYDMRASSEQCGINARWFNGK